MNLKVIVIVAVEVFVDRVFDRMHFEYQVVWRC